MNHQTTNVSTFDLRAIELRFKPFLAEKVPYFLGGFVLTQKICKIMVTRDYNYFHQLRHKILHK